MDDGISNTQSSKIHPCGVLWVKFRADTRRSLFLTLSLANHNSDSEPAVCSLFVDQSNKDPFPDMGARSGIDSRFPGDLGLSCKGRNSAKNSFRIEIDMLAASERGLVRKLMLTRVSLLAHNEVERAA